jgi:hypothetical protein
MHINHIPYIIYHEMYLNHMLRICAKCVPSMYIDHQKVPHIDASITSSTIQHSNHVPQTSVISLIICLNQLP